MLSIRQSTHQHIKRRRYTDAKHAADVYVLIKMNIGGCCAIDLQKPIVDTSPRPEAPGTDNIDELNELRHTFSEASKRCDLVRFQAWHMVRIDDYTQKAAASALSVSQPVVLKYIRHVDSKVEQVLCDLGMMRSKPRLDKEPIVDVYEEGDGDARKCGGSSRARLVVVGVDA